MLGIRASRSNEESEPDERWGVAHLAAPARNRTPRLQRWVGERPPTRTELEAQLKEEGLVPWITREDPDTTYGRHAHDSEEVRIIVRGAMKFGLADGDEVVLGPGDRIDLPPGVPHTAKVVDDDGVEYLCASREQE